MKRLHHFLVNLVYIISISLAGCCFFPYLAQAMPPTSGSPENNAIIPTPTPFVCPAPNCFRPVSGQISCVCCEGQQIPSNDACVCPGNQIPSGTSCSCPVSTTWNGSECVSPSCPVYQFTILQFWSSNPRKQSDPRIFIPPSKNSQVSDWLFGHFQTARQRCIDAGHGFDWWRGIYLDDCVKSYFLGNANPQPPYERHLPPRPIVYPPTPFQLDLLFNNNCAGPNLSSRAKRNCTIGRGIYYIDAGNNVLSTVPTGAEICDAGYIEWAISPISLIWDKTADIDQNLGFSKFPLDPSRAGEWFIWKASSKTPLLVYDPRDSKTVNSSFQLFGNWTFGGKNNLLANLSTPNGLPKKIGTKWENGFEALATLDANADNKLDGNELAPLSLWFDDNRDGVSQSGEVKRLSEVGVNNLFYGPVRIEAATNNIWADVGYTRIVDGKEEVGRAVDWHSDSAPTKAELLNQHMAHGILCQDRQLKTEDFNNIAKNERRASHPGKQIPDSESLQSINDIWQWKSEDEQFPISNFAPQGILGLSVDNRGRISGHSYAQIHFKPDYKHAKSMLVIRSIDGEAAAQLDGNFKLIFTAKDDLGNIITTNAVFIPSEMKIHGTSVAAVQYEGKPVTIKYRWVAIKLE